MELPQTNSCPHEGDLTYPRKHSVDLENNMAASLNYMLKTKPQEKNQPQEMGPLKLQKALRRSAPPFFRP